MELTTITARRMMDSLPDYYHGNDLAERIVQSCANAVDRLEAHAESVRRGFVPTLADDEHGLLSEWEHVMGLPVAPPDATVGARQDNVAARFTTIGDGRAKTTLAALRKAARTEAIVVKRNTPQNLVDTIETPYAPGSYSAAQIEALAENIWPAHREILMRYEAGFLLDISRLDEDAL